VRLKVARHAAETRGMARDIDPRTIKDPTSHMWWALGGLVVTLVLAALAPGLAVITLLLTLVWAGIAVVRARRLLRYTRGKTLDE